MFGTPVEMQGAIEFEEDDDEDEVPAADPGTAVSGEIDWGCLEGWIMSSFELHA